MKFCLSQFMFICCKLYLGLCNRLISYLFGRVNSFLYKSIFSEFRSKPITFSLLANATAMGIPTYPRPMRESFSSLSISSLYRDIFLSSDNFPYTILLHNIFLITVYNFSINFFNFFCIFIYRKFLYYHCLCQFYNVT